MNNRIIVRNRIIKLFSVIVVVVLAAAVVVGFLLLNKKTTSENGGYSIIVDDDITVYEGETFTLVPYLINKDGTVEESRFDYSPSDKSISVSSDGVISINSIPENDVYVDISERNTSISAKVKVNVVGKLTKVLGFTFSDLAGNKVLVSGTQQLRLGETYIINVVTEPRKVEIKPYCILQALNSSGVEKEVFELTYDKTDVSMKVVGLGAGKLDIKIKNDDNRSIYETDFDFSISMNDDNLSQEILSSYNQPLMSKGDLAEIETVELSRNISSLDGLKNLQSLKTVVFTADNVMDVTDISADYCYRIKEDLFDSYLASETWADYLKNIIPYEEGAEQIEKEVFVVYHNSKTESGEESITYDKLNTISSFPVYVYEGYKHFGWLDEDGEEVTVEQLKESVDLNGIHLYAGWDPISYTIIYHVRGYDTTDNQETWYYDQEGLLKTAQDVAEYVVRTGYKFAGWSRNASSSIYSNNINYRKDEAVSNLTSEDGAEINLYDIWEPIEYTISFKTDDETVAIDDMTVKYDTPYTLPLPSKPGYSFKWWQIYNGEDTFNAGVQNPISNPELNLADTDGAEVILVPIFEENSYTIVFKLNGGRCINDANIVEGAKVTLNFTQPYTLPDLEKEGYTAFIWHCVENNGDYMAGNTISRLDKKGNEITLVAQWTEAVYTINYYCQGGNIDGESYVERSRGWDDGVSLLTPTRVGHTFKGWKDVEHGVTYTPTDDKWSGNLIESAADNGAIFNLYADWQVNYYNLVISTGAGTTLTVKVDNKQKGDGTYSVAYDTTITVSCSANTGYKNATASFSGGTMPAKELTITSSAEQIKYTVSKSNGTNGDKVTINKDKNNTYTYGSTVSFTLSAASGYKDPVVDSITYGSNTIKYTNSSGTYKFTMPASNVTIKVSCTDSNSCFIKGTLITLADGSVKPVEELKLGDSILSYNHFEGRYESAAISLLFAKEVEDYPILNLQFDNGSKLQIVNMHGLFDCELNKYVMLDYFNASEYIGHTFVSVEYVNGIAVSVPTKLVSADVTYMTTMRYSLVTAYNINHVANGLLAVSDETEGLYNVFDYGDNMRYDEASIAADIATYGLADYSDWSELITYEEFLAFNGQYINIALAKNLTTREKLIKLIYTYVYAYGRA